MEMVVTAMSVAIRLPGLVGGVISGTVVNTAGAETLPAASLAFTEMIDKVAGENPASVYAVVAADVVPLRVPFR